MSQRAVQGAPEGEGTTTLFCLFWRFVALLVLIAVCWMFTSIGIQSIVLAVFGRESFAPGQASFGAVCLVFGFLAYRRARALGSMRVYLEQR